MCPIATNSNAGNGIKPIRLTTLFWTDCVIPPMRGRCNWLQAVHGNCPLQLLQRLLGNPVCREFEVLPSPVGAGVNDNCFGLAKWFNVATSAGFGSDTSYPLDPLIVYTRTHPLIRKRFR